MLLLALIGFKVFLFIKQSLEELHQLGEIFEGGRLDSRLDGGGCHGVCYDSGEWARAKRKIRDDSRI